ncbi:phenylacetate--CoA ligase family protein [Aquabacterium sp. OR-4]|uniref:phenylacetate--CoA ligase family protein n=1 Tax=Aquabacterium sp. OR-4 TaxID=2978127 RepID=UPI0028C5654D|nr:phenylacetate--CoA ligase family protein [Aquabacterium sp. OR-4]MDT7836765.1 phenylacetate--CoA ligase family protein [Aquabacterium sp. OR-4]
MGPVFDALQASAAAMAVLAAAGDSPARLARHQAQRLAALLTHAQQASPWWRERLRGIDPARTPLHALPVSRRGELMADFDHWVTDPALRLAELRAFTADASRIAEPWLDRYLVWESSGTSGLPGVFVHDAATLAVYDALEALRRSEPPCWWRWLDPAQLGERLVFVGATGGHFASLVSLRRLQRLQPWRGAALGIVSILQPTAELVAELNALQPSQLATYPSAAALLADEAAAGRLRIRPRTVWTGGETLTDSQRRHIAHQLGCPVRDSYGASEFLPIGWQCRHGALHVNADWVILEPVDEHHRPVPPGSLSANCLLTNLANRVQPLIRYELGDRIRIAAERCRCGSPLPVLQVQGRHDDRLVMAGRQGHPVTLLPLALSTVLEEQAGLYDFTLTQRDRHTLVLQLPLPAEQAADALARGCAALSGFAAQQGVARPRVLGEAGRPVPHGRSGKAQRITAMA